MGETVKQKIIKHFNDLIDGQRRGIEIRQRWLKENPHESPEVIKTMKKGINETADWISEYKRFIRWLTEVGDQKHGKG